MIMVNLRNHCYWTCNQTPGKDELAFSWGSVGKTPYSSKVVKFPSPDKLTAYVKRAVEEKKKQGYLPCGRQS